MRTGELETEQRQYFWIVLTVCVCWCTALEGGPDTVAEEAFVGTLNPGSRRPRPRVYN